MDLSNLAVQVFDALKPFLPIIATEASKKIGEELPTTISKIWSAIRNRASGKLTAKESVDDLIRKPNDPDTQASFRVQLKKLLDEDEEFAGDVAKLLKDFDKQKGDTTTIYQIGNGSTAIGRMLGNIVINQGDQAESSSKRKQRKNKK